MCPCLGLYICGHHAESIREGLDFARSFAEGSEARSFVMEQLRRQYGEHRVTLIANLENPLKENV